MTEWWRRYDNVKTGLEALENSYEHKNTQIIFLIHRIIYDYCVDLVDSTKFLIFQFSKSHTWHTILVTEFLHKRMQRVGERRWENTRWLFICFNFFLTFWFFCSFWLLLHSIWAVNHSLCFPGRFDVFSTVRKTRRPGDKEKYYSYEFSKLVLFSFNFKGGKNLSWEFTKFISSLK